MRTCRHTQTNAGNRSHPHLCKRMPKAYKHSQKSKHPYSRKFSQSNSHKHTSRVMNESFLESGFFSDSNYHGWASSKIWIPKLGCGMNEGWKSWPTVESGQGKSPNPTPLQPPKVHLFSFTQSLTYDSRMPPILPRFSWFEGYKKNMWNAGHGAPFAKGREEAIRGARGGLGSDAGLGGYELITVHPWENRGEWTWHSPWTYID